MTDSFAVESAINDAHRREWGRVLAATLRVTRDLDVAEECVQEAYAAAIVAWRRDGVPDNPVAWLTTVSKRRAVDALRRENVSRSKWPLLFEGDDVKDNETGSNDQWIEATSGAVPDERLRLIFMCCHPALHPEAQMALTLRLVCGLSTEDIARVSLVSPSTMSARLTRAKKKIAVARIKVALPREEELPERLRSVLGAIYLLFTSGHTAPSGVALVRVDLIEESLHLARMLRSLMPDEPEVAGLLAMVLVAKARRDTRVDATGKPVLLEDQDRSKWSRAAIDEARAHGAFALRRPRPGPYALQAAIALLYVEAPTFAETPWPNILSRYDDLFALWPSPVVALNRAVVTSKVAGAEVALRDVEELERDDRLARYHYLFAVKAALFEQLGRDDEAKVAYRRAAQLTTNEVESRYLFARSTP